MTKVVFAHAGKAKIEKYGEWRTGASGMLLSWKIRENIFIIASLPIIGQMKIIWSTYCSSHTKNLCSNKVSVSWNNIVLESSLIFPLAAFLTLYLSICYIFTFWLNVFCSRHAFSVPLLTCCYRWLHKCLSLLIHAMRLLNHLFLYPL